MQIYIDCLQCTFCCLRSIWFDFNIYSTVSAILSHHDREHQKSNYYPCPEVFVLCVARINSCIEVSLIHGQRFEQNKCFSIDGQFAHISLMPCCADNLHTLIYRVPEYCSAGKPCCGDNPSGCQHRSAAVDHFQWETFKPIRPSVRH